MNRTRIKIQNAIIVLLILALALTIFQVLHIQFSHSLAICPYPAQQHIQVLTPPTPPTITTKQIARTTISQLFDTPHIYCEKNLPQGQNGRSMILWRLIQIDNQLDLHTYIITYAHELCHIRYQVGNETYVAYMTFVRLYESDNHELRYHALLYANDVISGCYDDTQYDCGYYILDYLKGENK